MGSWGPCRPHERGGGTSEASVCRVEAVQGGGAVAARQGAVLVVADILQGEEVLLERRR